MTVHDERVLEVLEGEEAWIVGGAVRDALLGRPILDLDVACRDPQAAARRFAARYGGSPFPLSERHGAWRVVADGSEETVDFTPLRGSIEDDLATRDFTFNAIAVPVPGGDAFDPFGGRRDLEAGLLRVVSDDVFDADPLRLLRAVRLEDELGIRMDERAESLVRAAAGTRCGAGRRAHPGRAAPALRLRLSAPRRARAARAARRLARRAGRRAGRRLVPVGGRLRRAAATAADLA